MKPFNDACVPAVYVTSYKNWPTTEVTVGTEKVTRSLHFPRLTVEELQKLRKTAPETLTKIGSFGTPAYLIFDANREKVGERMDRGTVTSAKMLEDLKKFAGGATVEVWRAFDRARSAAMDEDLAKAIKALPGLDKMKGMTDAMKKEAESLRTRVAERGEERIREAEELWDINPDSAKKALEELLEIFKGHALEKKIRERLKK